MSDSFEFDDAPYVLGALDPDDRRAFEAHLETCADCRARVDELRGTADLLARARPGLDVGAAFDTNHDADLGAAFDTDLDDHEPVPDTLLPGLLRRAARERRRRRVLTGTLGALVAACLVALAIVVWPGGGSPARPPAEAFAKVQPVPVTVTARLTAKAWGTQIELHCTYASYEGVPRGYDLVVVDRSNHRHVAGDWLLVPGRTAVDFTTGTAVGRDDIRQLQVRAPDGTPLLELRP